MSKQGPTLQEYRKMSASELKRINKDALVKAIAESTESDEESGLLQELRVIHKGQEELKGMIDNFMARLISLESAVEDMKRNERWKPEVDAHETRIAALERTIETELKENRVALERQQKYLEDMDSKERGKNLIIVGLSESDGEDQDVGKVKAILTSLEAGDGELEIKRLGTKAENSRRPILVTVASKKIRDDLVKKARTSKSQLLKDIRVKRDTHPSIRREWGRLHGVKMEEERKPENAAKTIAIDYKKRQVTCDNAVIASWNPVF